MKLLQLLHTLLLFFQNWYSERSIKIWLCNWASC